MRIEGRRYLALLVKTDDPSLSEALHAEVSRKDGDVPNSEGGVWIFRMAPLTAA